jgi:hypothetical protein
MAVAISVALVGCGEEVGRDVPLGARLTSEAATSGVPPAPTSAAVPPTRPAISPVPQPTLNAVALAQVNNLGRLILTEQDLGPTFAVQRSDRSFREAIVETQAGIPELAAFLNSSTLQGAWAVLYGRTVAPGGTVSSIAYLFATPEDALEYVRVFDSIETTDYLSAIAVDRIVAPAVGDEATAVRFRTTSGRSLEVMWSEGPLVGQVIIRHAEDREEPEDAALLAQLATTQAARMAAALP